MEYNHAQYYMTAFAQRGLLAGVFRASMGGSSASISSAGSDSPTCTTTRRPTASPTNGKQIIDNMSNNKVITIQESDRGDAGSARVVFNALYKDHCKVFVTAVYELRPTTEAPRQ
jgi:hypothetical protein